MIRYTILRLLIFVGCLALFWLLGLREGTELAWLAVISAIVSMVISAFVLKPFRADMIRQIEERQARKAEAKAARPDTDEAVEDRARDAEEGPDTDEDAEDESYR